jgi:hypothetical protein
MRRPRSPWAAPDPSVVPAEMYAEAKKRAFHAVNSPPPPMLPLARETD